jgi:isopenicillin N synthase-like dioxygenase
MEFLKYATQSRKDLNIGHNMHTDLGTLSLLLCVEWGLQVRLQDKGCWEYVEPRSGLAIVNVGDTLRFLSGKKLRSVLHRVVPMKEHETEVRYTVGYFLRAENEMVFKDQEGNLTTAKKWHDRKVDIYQAAHAEQGTNTILTGGLMSVTEAQY